MASWTQRLFGARRKQDEPSAQAGADVDALIVQGNALEDAGDYDAALAFYRQALAQAPASPRTHVNIGNALKLMGRLPEAIAAQQSAIHLDPSHAGAHCNLGSLLAATGELAGAEEELRTALDLKPDLASASILLAHVFSRTGRTREAEQALRRVLELQPHDAIASHNLASLLLRAERLDEAEDILIAAGAHAHDPAALAATLGALYSRTGRTREAEPLFREALARPEYASEAISPHLFTLNLRDDLAPADVFAEHRALGARIGGNSRSTARGAQKPADPDRPLRVGYVSADFRQHPVGLFMRPVLERHDRSRISVHCYANSAVEDDFTRVLKNSGAMWRSIAGLDDDAAAAMIRADAIDILVDLSGHTTDNRLPVFARRAAAIQVTWLGYLNTTGVAAMDYRLCDRHTDPVAESAERHTERLAHLSDSQWCYAPVYDVPLPHRARTSAALTFGAFNQYSKISETCLALWGEVLAAVPHSTLRIYGVPKGRTRDRLRERLLRTGFDVDRVDLRDRVGILEYFAAIGDVDVALDAYPYNGATTTLDTLWMGTPLVALRGPASVSRGSYSILTALGLPALVADSHGRYVALHAALARDAAWRAELHGTLRERLAASPLMDTERFVRNLEDLYRRMWVAACRDEASHLT